MANSNAQAAEEFANSIELQIGVMGRGAEKIFELASNLAYRSVKVGSEITGSPGQPVDTGALRDSYTMIRPSRWTREIFSPLIYAPFIEAGIGPHGPLTLRSLVGGWHSLKLTVASWQRIVDLAARDVRSGNV